MSRLSDDAILDLLETSLVDERPSRDDEAALLHLRAALSAAGSAATVTVLQPRPRLPRRLVQRPLAAALATAIVVSGGAAAAAVGTDSLPPALDRVAFTLGLPVTDPALLSARDAIATLSDAISARDPGAVSAALRALRSALAALNVAEMAELDPNASAVIGRAEQFLAGLHQTTLRDATSPHDGSPSSHGEEGEPSRGTSPTTTSGSDDASPSSGGTGLSGDSDDAPSGTAPTAPSGSTTSGGSTATGSTDGGTSGSGGTDGGSGTSGSGGSDSGSSTAMTSTSSSDGGGSSDGGTSSGTTSSTDGGS
jgi:hypothetical protein